MSGSAESLARARQYYEAENFAQAEQLSRDMVRANPDHAEGWLVLGEACQAQDRHADAERAYRRAVELAPEEAAGRNGLAIALAQQGRLEDAASCFLELLARRPEDARALHNLGLVRAQQGRLDEAVACYQRALELRPDFAEAHHNLGLVREFQGKFDEARACYEQSLRLRPLFPEAHDNLVRLDNPEAHYFRGNVLREQRLDQEAAASYRQALSLRSDFYEAQNNLGVSLTNLGLLKEAEASCRHAVWLRPGEHFPYNNLGLALREQGKVEEAAACFREALRLRPDYAEAHHNLARLLLQQGRFEEGWPELEWRWRCPEFVPRSCPQPRWDGSPLGGRTILLYAEQGLGDTLHFVRYAPLVKARGGVVLLECQPVLLPLLGPCPGIDRLVGQGEPLPAFDVQVPLLSLPGLFGTRLDTIPAQVPYVSADPSRVAGWRKELGDGGLKVGIAWHGNPLQLRNPQRSAPLAQFAALAEIAGVRLYSVQKGSGTEQLAGAGFPVIDWGCRLDEFGATAALLSALDLVVTVDTAVAHCAGALGMPVWVALSFHPDWRYMLGREDSPWYPTMRLFRQPEPGNWDAVFQRIAAEVKKLHAKDSNSATLTQDAEKL